MKRTAQQQLMHDIQQADLYVQLARLLETGITRETIECCVRDHAHKRWQPPEQGAPRMGKLLKLMAAHDAQQEVQDALSPGH